MKHTKDQTKAINQYKDFLLSPDKYFIIQGNSGAGKSYIIDELANVTQAYYDIKQTVSGEAAPKKIYITATTNQAAAILGSLTKKETCTIHSLLGLKPVNNYSTGETELKQEISKVILNTYNTGVIFIDEASMINTFLFEYINNTADIKIVLIGDWYQLAPVKEHKIIMQEMAKKGTKTAVLEEIIRNKGIIATNGQRCIEGIKTGSMEPIQVDGKIVHHLTGSAFQKAIDNEFKNDPIESAYHKILAYKNITVSNYIEHIRELKGLSMVPVRGERVITNKPIYNPNDRIVVGTDSEVVIKEIHPYSQRQVQGYKIRCHDDFTCFMPANQQDAKTLTKQYAKQKDWDNYFFIKNHWLDLRMPYASTVHKAQGATYKNVYINLGDIGSCFDRETVYRLVYVAMTRASEQVILYGNLPKRYGEIEYV